MYLSHIRVTRFSLHVTLLTAFPPLSLLVRSLIVCCSVIALSTIYFPKFLVVLAIHALDPDRDKLDKRAIKYVFLGYSRTQKWYKCYSPFLQCHFVCADVLLRLPVRTLVTISPIEKAIAGLCWWKKLFAPHLLVPPSSAQSGGSSAPLLFPLQSILIPFLLQFVGVSGHVPPIPLHSLFPVIVCLLRLFTISVTTTTIPMSSSEALFISLLEVSYCRVQAVSGDWWRSCTTSPSRDQILHLIYVRAESSKPARVLKIWRLGFEESPPAVPTDPSVAAVCAKRLAKAAVLFLFSDLDCPRISRASSFLGAALCLHFGYLELFINMAARGGRGGRGNRGRRGRYVTCDHGSEHARDIENELDHQSGEETDSSTDERSDRGRQRPVQRNGGPNRWEDRIVCALQASKEYGVQVNIKEFDGDMEPEAFLDWIDSIESYFDWKEVPTERKVKLVGAKLRGPASTWWRHYQNDREVRAKGKIRRWDKMKEKLKSQFLPRDYEQTLYQSVQNLRQHLKTVKEYTQEFHRLSLRCNLAETESQKVSRYVNGLRLSIQDQVCLQRPYKVSDAYQLALKVETQLARSSSRRVGNDRSSGPSSSRSNNAIRDGRTAAPMRPNQQTNTGDRKGLQNQQNTQGQMNIKCYRCFEPGHKSNECPKRTTVRVNLAEDGEVEENCGALMMGINTSELMT
ncbi:hypothetical protein Acr_29g0009330 [Actinidia rufa]|uniref:CCHC-type domain-containing protein n=1 Tax=Actinidia rufa TaxID=165716 RepID=A0A7J0HFN8_9ERIC|nr:hypothetical protein Acr_29g0009330 [Actinidia rufa]